MQHHNTSFIVINLAAAFEQSLKDSKNLLSVHCQPYAPYDDTTNSRDSARACLASCTFCCLAPFSALSPALAIF